MRLGKNWDPDYLKKIIMFGWFSEKFNTAEVDKNELLSKAKMMNDQIQAVGGHLTFVMTADDKGWFAQCQEFEGTPRHISEYR